MTILKGKDAYINVLKQTSTESGAGTLTAPGGNLKKIVLVKSKGGSSNLVAKEKEIFIFKGSTDITLLDGDSVRVFDVVGGYPATGFEASSEEGELDITTQLDAGFIKTIGDGWVNLSGSIKGYYDSNNSIQDSIYDQYFSKIQISSDGSTMTRSDATGSVLYVIQLIQDNNATSGATESVVMGVTFKNVSLNVDTKAVRAFDLNFGLHSEVNPTRIKEVI